MESIYASIRRNNRIFIW